MKINSKQKSERDLHISQIKKSNFTEMKLSEIKLRLEIKKKKKKKFKFNKKLILYYYYLNINFYQKHFLGWIDRCRRRQPTSAMGLRPGLISSFRLG